eukprot:Nitzschia sp. Nitz4//scaffold5_size260463//239997//241394//NITZ4_001030-RA/size260463-processed-gene-0.409-mRNA-1//-1//CDS//3329555484//8438//frame0
MRVPAHKPRDFVAATVWDPQLGQRVTLPFTASEQLQYDYCDGDVWPCPEKCPENDQLVDSAYPYIRDWHDGLCKSSQPEAIPPARPFGGPCGCDTTCFTPQAVKLNSTWPWESAAEREAFHPPEKEGVMECPPEHTLSWVDSTVGTRKFDCSGTGKVSLNCDLYYDFSHHLLFFPKAKLIFCGIPKVGITEWLKFFRFAMGAQDYLSTPHYKIDRTNFFMSSLQMSKAEELLNDPSWTKAVFLRNPLERLLSAYMDKIVGSNFSSSKFNEPVGLSFEEFVNRAIDNSTASSCHDPNGLNRCTDPHWRPQSMTCGLDHFLPHFDFIGNFDNIAEHSKLLLEKVGMWEEYGAVFDDGRNMKHQRKKHHDSVCHVPPPVRGPDEVVYGFNQRGPSGTGKNHHATNSTKLFDKFYTPQLIRRVHEAYSLDYAIWSEISSPELPVNKVMTGRELKVVTDHCDGNDISPLL